MGSKVSNDGRYFLFSVSLDLKWEFRSDNSSTKDDILP